MSARSDAVLVDTGPLVAVLNGGDEHHAWAREVFGRLAPPLLTCEAVLSEVQFLVHDRGGDPLVVLRWVEQGILKLSFSAEREMQRLISLQTSYRNLPMDFADACLVRMSETMEACRVLTTDRHFQIYRRNQRRLIPLISPW